MASSALSLGTVVMGELSLEEQLGSAVYRARRTRDGRELSMRIVYPRTTQEGAEFLALAATASRVRHPALASVEAYGRLDSERCYIASELIGGQRLDEWADAVGIPPLAQVVELVRRLCVGLQAAARAGVVHDGIHARNVRVQSVPSGSNARMPVKLLSLGVPALLYNYAHDPDALRFMAPEQLQVLSRSELPTTFRCSAQMNVYSCGALLYYLATGGAPFAGLSAPEILAAQAGTPLAPPARINPQITAGLNAVVMRALAYDPSDRFASAAELGEALAAVFGSVAPPPKRERSSVQPVGDDMFGPEPPTFRTSVSSIAELERAAAFDAPRVNSAPPPDPELVENDVEPERDEKPTLPPAAAASTPVPAAGGTRVTREVMSTPPRQTPMPAPPRQTPVPAHVHAIGEMRDSVSGVAPIGLFSSTPPHLRTSGEVTNSGAPKATPLAAFSEPPRVVSAEAPLGSPPPPPPPRVRDSYPDFSDSASSPSVAAQQAELTHAKRSRRPVPWPLLAIPLAAAVCLIAFMSVRLVLGPDDAEQPIAALPTHPVSARAPKREPQPAAAAPATPSAPGATVALRPYISEAELEDDAVDEAPERGTTGSRPGHRARRAAAAAARRNNAPAVTTAQPPSAAPAANAPARAQERPAPPALVDEHIEEAAPPPTAAADAATRPKLDDHEATASVVVPLPEPVVAVAPKVERAPSVVLPLTARVRIEGVEVRGSLPKSHVRHGVERLTSQLKRCYEQAAQAAGHNGFGELIVGVEIDERGRARSPSVQGAGLPKLGGCVTETVQHLITGRVPDTGIVTATWKIVFMP